MTPRQILRTLSSLGGRASKTDLFTIAVPAQYDQVVEALARLEAEGLVTSEIRVTYALTAAGERELGPPSGQPVVPQGALSERREAEARHGDAKASARPGAS